MFEDISEYVWKLRGLKGAAFVWYESDFVADPSLFTFSDSN
jgi:hypothetical protein